MVFGDGLSFASASSLQRVVARELASPAKWSQQGIAVPLPLT